MQPSNKFFRLRDCGNRPTQDGQTIPLYVERDDAGQEHFRRAYHNGENGFVCSNTEEFVKAIKEAQNGADGFTERAYQDVLNMYNTKAMAKQYSEKYDKAINTPRGGVQHELILYVLTNDYATAKAVA